MCECEICRNKPVSYIRKCDYCGNFHNWKVLPSGAAVCGTCGRTNRPLPERIESEDSHA